MSVVIAACSPLQITSALAVAKKQILHSDGYQDDVAIRQRLAQISRISTDDDGNTSRQSVLEFFAPHQPDGDQDEESSIDWRDKGLCSGSDQRMFFPERGESALPAKKVCYGCEFREPCAEVAIERGEKFGVWGGLSERERRRIRSQRARARRQDVTEIPVAIAE
ncbi:WhiB family transcriptional regulator [Candidatus Saccharibacteria bacterium]|nr:WhiB family transcriptional regulator [Candidatus Saccharibacteria bacterium]